MSDEWKPYFDGRIIRHARNDVKIIKKPDVTFNFVVECPVCGFLMKDIHDAIAYDKYQCCQECTFKWAEANRQIWDEGWRPPQQGIEEHIKFVMNQPTMMVR